MDMFAFNLSADPAVGLKAVSLHCLVRLIFLLLAQLDYCRHGRVYDKIDQVHGTCKMPDICFLVDSRECCSRVGATWAESFSVTNLASLCRLCSTKLDPIRNSCHNTAAKIPSISKTEDELRLPHHLSKTEGVRALKERLWWLANCLTKAQLCPRAKRRMLQVAVSNDICQDPHIIVKRILGHTS
jgi:hypothetical protein